MYRYLAWIKGEWKWITNAEDRPLWIQHTIEPEPMSDKARAAHDAHRASKGQSPIATTSERLTLRRLTIVKGDVGRIVPAESAVVYGDTMPTEAQLEEAWRRIDAAKFTGPIKDEGNEPPTSW